MFLASRKADVGGLTGDFALDIIDRTDTVQRLAGDGRFGFAPLIVEITPQVRPTRRLTQPGRSISVRSIELGIALVGISLQDAAGLGQMVMVSTPT